MTDVKERPSGIAASAAEYDADFSRWTERQAELLRAHRFSEIDLPHVIDEIESLGKEQRRALQSSYRLLIAHLLKWRYQPSHRGRSWALTVVRERGNIDDFEEESPSLAAAVSELIPKAYARARKEASVETGLPISTFPAACPFTLDELRDDAFLPD